MKRYVQRQPDTIPHLRNTDHIDFGGYAPHTHTPYPHPYPENLTIHGVNFCYVSKQKYIYIYTHYIYSK